MSLSIGGYPPGFGHPSIGSMGVSSAQDFYSAHYPVQMHAYPEYGVGDRNNFHSWMLGGGAGNPAAVAGLEASMSPPNSYGTPSPGSVNHGYTNYSDSDPCYKHWQQDYNHNVPGDLGVVTGLSGVPDPALYEAYTNSYGERCYRRRTNANRKERRRTLSINNAFSNLRGSIPNVPSDTKLSKIKTLRLAISYIAYLNEVLEKGDTDLAQTGFKADISRKRERRVIVEEKKTDNCDSDDSTGSNGSSGSDGKSKGRTGWPQTVWASELKSASPN